ncbi:hypothetical protein FRC08_007275 [Ceratobasidium sp. 394]|nr:hypothetical protein FRC08_007275 [Ceratobasidium sp. 394]
MARKTFPCPRCSQKFRSGIKLDNHLRDTHERAGPSGDRELPETEYPCIHCGKGLPMEHGLSQHLGRDAKCKVLHDAWKKEQLAAAHLAQSMPSGRIPQVDQFGSDQPESSDQVVHDGNDEGRDGGVFGDDYEDRVQGLDGDGDGDEGEDEDEDEDEDESYDGSEASENSDDDANEYMDEDSQSTESEHMMDLDPNLPGGPNTPPAGIVDDENEHIVLIETIDQHGNHVYIEEYPSATAGEPIGWDTTPDNRKNYPDVGQLKHPDCFEIAQLLLESGVSAKLRNRFLKLKRYRGSEPWKNNRELLKDVDKLPRGPDWVVQAIHISGDRGEEVVELWMRNALEIVKRLLKDKRLGPFMDFKPRRKWTSPERTERIRDEINTADWMWEIQAEIQSPDGTVIPIIISSDETKLTSFSGDKKAHPVYLTIGNLPKRLRRRISKRTNILLGYLPVPKLDCESNPDMRRIHRRDLFHKCMKTLLAPLAEACETGVEVTCADGGIRRIYPALASYITDFPEQCKVACTKSTHCPLCTVRPSKRGDLGDAPPRTREQVLDAMKEHKKGGSAAFERLGLYDVEPFWKSYPYVNLGCLLTPDLLHQVHKGVMKDHLTNWVKHVLGKQVIDERHTTMPEYHGMRHFKNGISTVSQWTGRELKEMAKVLLPVMSDADPQVVQAGRALLDFMYLAHSSSLTDKELNSMEDALRTFHANKAVFQRNGAVATKKAFHGIPKIHMIQHYVYLVKQLGTPDGYNTETSERLHIDFAKLGYRASNKVNYIKQMALYIQRVEAVAMHAEYLVETKAKRPQAQPGGNDLEDEIAVVDIEEELAMEEWDEWYDEELDEDPDELQDAGVRFELAAKLDEFLNDGRVPIGGRWEVEPPQPGDQGDQGPRYHPVPECVVAKTPTTSRITVEELTRQHGATKLQHSLALFLRKQRPSGRLPEQTVTPELKLNIWSRARLFHSPPPFKPSEGPHIDVIRAQPEKIDAFERVSRPARFDTVLVLTDKKGRGVHRYRPARVRVIFELPTRLRHLYDGKLAYVEMFNATSHKPLHPTGLFTTTRSILDGSRVCAIIPLLDIRMTCHLAPRYNLFHPDTPLTVYSDVLQLCDKFFLNIFVTYFCYELFRHWSQHGGDEYIRLAVIVIVIIIVIIIVPSVASFFLSLSLVRSRTPVWTNAMPQTGQPIPRQPTRIGQLRDEFEAKYEPSYSGPEGTMSVTLYASPGYDVIRHHVSPPSAASMDSGLIDYSSPEAMSRGSDRRPSLTPSRVEESLSSETTITLPPLPPSPERTPSLRTTQLSSISFTTPEGNKPSIESEEMVYSDHDLDEGRIPPSHIISHDVNRLLQYLHDIDTAREGETRNMSDQLWRIEEELFDLSAFLCQRRPTPPPAQPQYVPFPVEVPAPAPAPTPVVVPMPIPVPVETPVRQPPPIPPRPVVEHEFEEYVPMSDASIDVSLSERAEEPTPIAVPVPPRPVVPPQSLV